MFGGGDPATAFGTFGGGGSGASAFGNPNTRSQFQGGGSFGGASIWGEAGGGGGSAFTTGEKDAFGAGGRNAFAASTDAFQSFGQGGEAGFGTGSNKSSFGGEEQGTTLFAKPAPRNIPPKTKNVAKDPSSQLCRFNSRPGGCRKGSSCPFRHSGQVDDNPFSGSEGNFGTSNAKSAKTWGKVAASKSFDNDEWPGLYNSGLLISVSIRRSLFSDFFPPFCLFCY
jgi:hypothetical protein